MGVVYLARELRLDRKVAIKLLPPDRAIQPAARERFLREARTAAQLSHPGIVPIFAVHEVSDLVYFAMAYVDGDTLGRRVRKRGPMPYDTAARLLEEVARALAYAHARGAAAPGRDHRPLPGQGPGRALPERGSARRCAGRSARSPRGRSRARLRNGGAPALDDGTALRRVHGRGPAALRGPVAPAGGAAGPGRDARSRRHDRSGAARRHGRAGAAAAQGGIRARGPRRCAPRGAVPPARGAGVSLRRRAVAARACLATAVLRVRRDRGRHRRGAGADPGASGCGGGSLGVCRRRRGGPPRRRRRAGAHRASYRPEGRAAAAILERTVGWVAVYAGRAAGAATGDADARRALAGRYARTGRAGRLTRASRRAASASISSVLQNANRTRRRPNSGRLKKLEPGTGATPISFVSQKENSSSGSSETPEQSAST